MKGQYLHSEKGDTGEEVHCGLEVLQPLGAAGREVVLQSDGKRNDSEPQDMRSHPSLSSVCLCLWARSSRATQFPMQNFQHLLLCGCAVFPGCVCACFRGAVTLTNASACFCLHRFWQRWGEIKRRKAVETEEVGWCSSMQFVYPVVVIYHKLLKVLHEGQQWVEEQSYSVHGQVNP